MISISVIDTGSGISPIIIDNLKRAFQTYGNDKNQNKEGIGLGLFNVSKFITIMGNAKKPL